MADGEKFGGRVSGMWQGLDHLGLECRLECQV